jgi:PAS domain S-box-containing protein
LPKLTLLEPAARASCRSRLVARGLTLPLLGSASIAALIAMPLQAQRAAPPPGLAAVLVDANADFIPDRLGQPVRVSGIVSTPPREARGTLEYVVIQDSTVGVRLIAQRATGTLDSLRPGDVVEADGVLQQHRGAEEVLVHDIRRLRAGTPPTPRPALVTDLQNERLSGVLVRVTGRLSSRLARGDEREFELRDRSGSIDLRIPKRILTDPAISERLLRGGDVDMDAIVGQSTAANPPNTGYRLAPRDPNDLRFAPEPPYVLLGVSTTVLLLSALSLYLWLRRRHAEGRTREMEVVMRSLEQSREAVARQLAAEAAQAASEAELRAVFGAMRDVVLVLSREGRYVRIPATNADRLYAPPQELVGRTVHEVLPKNDADAVCATIRDALERGETVTEYVLNIGDAAVCFAGVVSPLDAETVVWVARDVTARRQAEAELRGAHAMLQSLIDVAPQAVVTLDLERNVTRWNQAAERILGWSPEEVIGSAVPFAPEDLSHEQWLGTPSFTAQGNSARELEAQCLCKDGSRVFVIMSSSVLREPNGRHTGYVVVLTDISERKSLEAQLRQAQKLEAVGQLAGGIAHDFNNLLTVIQAHATFLAESVERSDARHEDVQEIHKASVRAAGLTRQLLAFSRKQLLKPRVLNLNETVAGVQNMLRRLIGEDVEIVMQLASEAGLVLADPGQLEQVLVNLAVNARDAMPIGGRLTFETFNVERYDADATQPPVMVAGRYVVLAVSDSGAGMDAPTLARIFEPFFTTKEQGKGTGLGLSTVYGIVKQSGGYIWCYSEPGLGTTFKIYLPRVDRRAIGDESDRALAAIAARGSETVLLVEDEDGVREIARRVLVRQGYSVLVASNGRAALSLAAQHQGQIDLLLTDVVMPELGGPDLARELTCARPDLKVLWMSGYTNNEVIRRGILTDAVTLLQKPFEPDDLAIRVRNVLDSVPSERGRLVAT